jgi:F-type H+-transporting ATPase subunit delta
MAHDLLHGYAAATFESARAAGSLEQAGRDLEVFSAALTSSEELRRALLDPLIGDQTRRAIARDLLAGRATTEVAALIDFALRVVRPSELALALADIEGHLAALIAGVAEAPTSGRQAVRARIRGYAERALEELAALSEVDAVEDELFSFARIVEQSTELRELLANTLVPVAGRRAVLADLFGDKLRGATLRLVSYVLSAGAVRDLVGTYEWLVELAAEERGRRIAQVRAAVDLSEEERARLGATLSELVHREVEIRVVTDPDVVGGVLVSVGDLLIDGTVRLRFERLRDAIAQWA